MTDPIIKDKIEEEFNARCSRPSDINQHLPALREYSSQCSHVTEFGVCDGNSTWALISGRPKTMISYDKDYWPVVEKVKETARGLVEYAFIQQDVLLADIALTDLLFNTWHKYPQLKQELALHGNKASKFIIMHDTFIYAHWHPNFNGNKGLVDAINEWLAENPQWQIKQVFENNNGLTILERLEVNCPSR